MRDLSRRHEIAVQRMLNESAERRAGIRADTQAVLRALDRFESQSG